MFFTMCFVNTPQCVVHSVEKREIHCHANIFSWKQFRVKFFSEKSLSRNFCEKMVAVKFCNLHTVWYLQKFTFKLFWQKFRESKSFTKKLQNSWFDEKTFSDSKFFIWQFSKEFYCRDFVAKIPSIFFFVKMTFFATFHIWFTETPLVRGSWKWYNHRYSRMGWKYF